MSLEEIPTFTWSKRDLFIKFWSGGIPNNVARPPLNHAVLPIPDPQGVSGLLF
jgi:hypothetical protein